LGRAAKDRKTLEDLTFAVYLEDLERYLKIKIAPDERLLLEQRMHQKMEEACIKSLLETVESSELSFVVIPRLPRFFKSGTEVKTTAFNLLRNFPQLFENVSQVIKYRTESFFVQQTLDLDWAIVSCEVLPDSLNKNYGQQRQVLKQHAYQYQATESRVRRRNLVDALYDLIVVQIALKKTLLKKTADLTESRIGQHNLAFINYGEMGIRISDISRRQSHTQLGVCPSW